VLDERTLVVSVSQSGETVDVLEAMQVAHLGGALQVTICNTEGAQTTRVADGTVLTRAGLERGVASTKCFTTAAVALYALALRLGQLRGTVAAEEVALRIAELSRLPDAAARALAEGPACRRMAEEFVGAQHMLFLGRGLAFPAAMEGADDQVLEIGSNRSQSAHVPFCVPQLRRFDDGQTYSPPHIQ